MGIFDKILGSKDDSTDNLNPVWTEIKSIDDLDLAIKCSEEEFVGVFKHSTRCSISRNVLRDFEKKLGAVKTIKCYYLDLLNNRDLSLIIADRFGVEHQSPQFIVFKEGDAILSASHDKILDIDIYNLSK